MLLCQRKNTLMAIVLVLRNYSLSPFPDCPGLEDALSSCHVAIAKLSLESPSSPTVQGVQGYPPGSLVFPPG